MAGSRHASEDASLSVALHLFFSSSHSFHEYTHLVLSCPDLSLCLLCLVLSSLHWLTALSLSFHILSSCMTLPFFCTNLIFYSPAANSNVYIFKSARSICIQSTRCCLMKYFKQTDCCVSVQQTSSSPVCVVSPEDLLGFPLVPAHRLDGERDWRGGQTWQWVCEHVCMSDVLWHASES